MDIPKIRVGRYEEKDQTEYAGFVEPHDQTWILFIRRDNGRPVLFKDRDPKTGAYLPEHRL